MSLLTFITLFKQKFKQLCNRNLTIIITTSILLFPEWIPNTLIAEWGVVLMQVGLSIVLSSFFTTSTALIYAITLYNKKFQVQMFL